MGIAFTARQQATRQKKSHNQANRMPTTAWEGFPPGPPKPGHFRTKRTDHHRPTECPHGPSDLFRLGSPSQGIFSFTRVITRVEATRISSRWSQKDAPMVWVDSPPLIRPGRGVQRGLRVQGLGFRVEGSPFAMELRRIWIFNPKPSTLNSSA